MKGGIPKMKLSEAIRKGCVKPQGFGSGTIGTDSETYCVLGAAASGAGLRIRSDQSGYDTLEETFPILKEVVANPPASVDHVYWFEGKKLTVMQVLYTANDLSKWTRERLADWVEEVEAELEECSKNE